jgi:hypothetical protein
LTTAISRQQSNWSTIGRINCFTHSTPQAHSSRGSSFNFIIFAHLNFTINYPA